MLKSISTFLKVKEVKHRPENLPAENNIIYDLSARSISGEEINFSDFKEKKILIVNTASECGYTYQYADLEKLHQQYGEQVIVLGFPANNFLGQEPGSNEDITNFCEINYGVSFQLFEKIDVTGNNIHPVFKWLSDRKMNGWCSQEPTWNFCKYLINEQGQLIAFFNANVKPMDKEVLQLLK